VRVAEFDQAAEQLHNLGIDHCSLKHRKGAYFEGDLSQQEQELLTNAGLSFEVIFKNSNDYYRQQHAREALKGAATSCSINEISCYDVPAFFELGSMNGFHRYSEILEHMNTMSQNYPELINAPTPISALETEEGNQLFHQRITSSTGSNKKQILFTALHHAREPMSATQLLFFMYHILEQYGNDPAINYLLDNFELYFIPCVNPDGYLYNEELFNPAAQQMFGFWRKNKRDNDGDGVFDPEVDGVDLNRNYGFEWGLDDQGSSPNPSSDTYRGESAFSEPETAAVREFTLAHNFEIALNYHTYGDYLIFPWGYDSNPTIDDPFFEAFAEVMTLQNKYTTGTGFETVGYLTNGDTDDWMYGEQTEKAKILSMTPEVGKDSDGFFPAQERLMDICRETLWQNINAVRVMGKYGLATSNAGNIITAQTGEIPYTLKRYGLQPGGSYAVFATPLHPSLSFENDGGQTTLGFGESVDGSINYTVDDTQAEYGDRISFILQTSNDGYFAGDTVNMIYLPEDEEWYSNILEPSTNDLADWQNNGWGVIATDFASAPASLTESPFGNYENNSFATLTLENVDLGQALQAELLFNAKWDIEKGYDYVQVIATESGQANGTALCGVYTSAGSANLDADAPVYDGLQSEWIEERISLDDFLGKSIDLSFRFVSDQFSTGDGFLLDDVVVRWNENEPEPEDTVTNTSVEETGLQLQLFPNPSTGELFVDGPQELQNSEVSLFDLSGRKIPCLIERNGSQLRIETDDLKGLYLLNVVFPDGTARRERVLFLSE